MSGFADTTYLAPHPWDTLGNPPKPGVPYGDAATVADTVADLRGHIERLVSDADELYERADELEEEAKVERSEGHSKMAEAQMLMDELRALGRGRMADALLEGCDPDTEPEQ